MEKVFGYVLSYVACLMGAVLSILVNSLYSDMSLLEEMSSIRPYIYALILSVVLVTLRNFREEREE